MYDYFSEKMTYLICLQKFSCHRTRLSTQFSRMGHGNENACFKIRPYLKFMIWKLINSTLACAVLINFPCCCKYYIL